MLSVNDVGKFALVVVAKPDAGPRLEAPILRLDVTISLLNQKIPARPEAFHPPHHTRRPGPVPQSETVEANLARIYRKLGISSRAELGATMTRTAPSRRRS